MSKILANQRGPILPFCSPEIARFWYLLFVDTFFMTKIQSLLNTFKSYFSSSGRMGRLEYFLIHLLSILIAGCLISLIFFLSIYFKSEKYNDMLLLTIPISITYWWINIVNTIKRFHDLEESWKNIFLLLIPIVNIVIAFTLLFTKWSDWKNKYDV